MRDRLRAGIAVYNAGEFHAAHDAWEKQWLDLDRETDDARLLQGLIQYTAAVYHASRRNWDGAVGLSGSGREYLADLPADYRDVGVEQAREYLSRLERDPERIERAPPWPLTHEGKTVLPEDLDPPALGSAAATVAEDREFDPGLIERAAARLEGCESGTAVDGPKMGPGEGDARALRALLADFVADGANRGIVHDRLQARIDRLEARDRDVEGLFD